jgi:hypothetical protein
MVRSTRGEKLLERARRRRGTSWARLARTEAASDVAVDAEVAEAARGGAAALNGGPAPQDLGDGSGSGSGTSHGEADPSLDVALYSCSCGLVFEAPVSTSVGCPHCGVHLAW